MGRFRDNSAGDGGEEAIDISPLIDCVFILLIFFIVTTTFVQEVGFEVDKPQPSSQPQDQDKTTIVLKLDESGRVFSEGRSIGIAGVQSEVKRVLQREEAPVVIQSAESTPAGILVRVMDEARLAGATKISLAKGG
jgi:biopolymer transport protein ExbD